MKVLLLISIILNTSSITFCQNNKRDKIKELLTLTHQDSFAIKKFENISSPPSENYSVIFSDSSYLNMLSDYVKDTSLLNNMKTIMKDTAYMSIIESFKSISSAKEKTNQEDIKKMALKFVNEDIVDMYDKKFSFDEIFDMIKFYKTNVGQKSLYIVPDIQNEINKKIETKYMTYMHDHSSRKN